MGILITLIILSVLVLIHEAGHYFAAKKFKIKVEEFGFGLPPRAWGKKIGETIYSVNWLPIGGFVKLFGEDEAGGGRVSLSESKQPKTKETEDIKRAFFARPVWQRATVVVAGVVMNALLAFVIYYVFMFLANFQTMLPLLTEHTFFGVQQTNFNDDGDSAPIISVVIPDSPAEQAGIVAPAVVVSINGETIENAEQMIGIINENKGKSIELVWESAKVSGGELVPGEQHTTTLTPRANPPENEGPTGIAFVPIAFLHYETPAQKIFSGVTHPINLTVYNFKIMSEIISTSIKEKDATAVGQAVSGPVGIFSLGGAINEIPQVKERIMQFLNLAGILSMSLAVFNILPIPALDGGRLFFIMIEGVFRRKVAARIENYAHSIGMAILIGLILIVTFKDIVQLFQ